MGKILIKPTKLQGDVCIPPSKSISHRAIICAALCEVGQVSVIENIILSDDMIATISSLKKLGVKIDIEKGNYNNKLIIKREKEHVDYADIDCKESGSTLRFLVPVSMLYSDKTLFEGRGRLVERTLCEYYDIFDKQGVEYKNTNGNLPLIVQGKLQSGEFSIKGDVSSQFLTGLMFTLPLLNGNSTIIITKKLESKGYVDLTIDVMKSFGIDIINEDYKKFYIKGNQAYRATNYVVEADYSQAAFFLVANELGNNINVTELSDISKQGDRKIKDIIEKTNELIVKSTNISTIEQKIDVSDIPDLVPILCLYFSMKNGLSTHLINAGRLRLKESDRIHAICSQMNLIGAELIELDDSIIIKGKSELSGGACVKSFNDHRIAMTLAIASTVCKKEIELDDYEAVKKSYPAFFDDFTILGGVIDELNMG